MKLKNIKINTQLGLGLGVILIFVIFLSLTAMFQTNSLWEETQGLFDHPLAVRTAIGQIQVDVLSIRLGLRDLLLAQSDPEKELIIQKMDVNEADAFKQLDIMYDRYLGPRSDIDEAHQAMVEWKTIRTETIMYVRTGMLAEADQRIRAGGVSAAQAEKVFAEIEDISNFAANRALEFYNEAKTQKEVLSIRLWIIAGIIFLLTGVISYILLKGINDPLNDLTQAANQFAQGKLTIRSHYSSTNEFGVLAATFNTLAESIEADIRNKEDSAAIADVMLRTDDIHSFCRDLLKSLMMHTDSQVGAVYLLNEKGSQFDHFDSIGLDPVRRSSFSASDNDGEFGAALATQQIKHIREIPADTQFSFSTVSADFKPCEIITIPILEGSKVVAMLSLASLHNYSPQSVRLVNDIWGVLIARLNGVLAFRQARIFSEKLESQNRELIEQGKELAVQADELSEQNIELEMQKKQLGETSRLKSSFLSNMSHELRTPLNSVIALSSVLTRRLKGTIPEDEYSYLDVIERNGKQLLTLINDILDLSRIESGREELTLSQFSIKDLVSEVVEMIEPQVREKGIALLNHVSPDMPTITSDQGKCRHILQNIVGNAVKFTTQGSVDITATQRDGDIHISVKDTGIGIPSDKIAYIFDEFRQADESTSRSFGGTGLGLSIARKYADLLHGSITVESAPGHGSTFMLSLPMSIMTLHEAKPVGASVELIQQGTPRDREIIADVAGKSLLLVEDSEPAIIQLKDILSSQGYNLQIARNGAEALEKIDTAVPDGMLLDLMMPEVDGFEVLRMLRRQVKTAQLPVLILTAKHVSPAELAFLNGYHITQLIQKGDINKKALLAAVARLVSPMNETPSAPQRKSDRAHPTGKQTIVVVEDNADNRRTVHAILQEKYILIEAEDGPTGIELVKSNQPDLVLLDISLPGMDGFKVLDLLRQDVELRDIPVVALTARAMKGDREQILSDGFDAYISKPVDAETLIKTIDEILNG